MELPRAKQLCHISNLAITDLTKALSVFYNTARTHTSHRGLIEFAIRNQILSRSWKLLNVLGLVPRTTGKPRFKLMP